MMCQACQRTRTQLYCMSSVEDRHLDETEQRSCRACRSSFTCATRDFEDDETGRAGSGQAVNLFPQPPVGRTGWNVGLWCVYRYALPHVQGMFGRLLVWTASIMRGWCLNLAFRAALLRATSEICTQLPPHILASSCPGCSRKRLLSRI